VPLDPATKATIDLTFARALEDPVLARMTALFARCWPDSSWDSQLHPAALIGETLVELADRLDLSWNPGWLEEVGYQALDADGHRIGAAAPATVPGPIDWSPAVRLPRVDDQVPDSKYLPRPASIPHRRRLAGEVALAALWRDAAATTGVAPTLIESGLEGGTRGARFRDAVAYIIKQRLVLSSTS
jgi:hypothetical protein